MALWAKLKNLKKKVYMKVIENLNFLILKYINYNLGYSKKWFNNKWLIILVLYETSIDPLHCSNNSWYILYLKEIESRRIKERTIKGK